jgi:hypothetical protein
LRHFFLELPRDAPTLRKILWLDAILELGVRAAMAFGDVLMQISNGKPKTPWPVARPAKHSRAHVRCDGPYGKARGIQLGAMALSFLANPALVGVTAHR